MVSLVAPLMVTDLGSTWGSGLPFCYFFPYEAARMAQIKSHLKTKEPRADLIII